MATRTSSDSVIEAWPILLCLEAQRIPHDNPRTANCVAQHLAGNCTRGLISMAPSKLCKFLALLILFLDVGLPSARAASFDCALSVVSSTGAVQGAQVDLDCTASSGTAEPQNSERPQVFYDSSLHIRTMTGGTLDRAKQRTGWADVRLTPACLCMQVSMRHL